MTTPPHLAPLGDGTTPLSADEAEQVIPSWIRTRGDLNDAEAAAIGDVQRRYALRVPALAAILTERWVRQLHEMMLAAVWRWAGTYRHTGKNIGIDWPLIPTSIRNLVEDAAVWFDHENPEVAAARLHHRIVAIHPFPDGNGRHGRLYTDLCLRSLARPPFTWGAGMDCSMEQRRQCYYEALRAADEGDPAPLERYVRA